MFYRMKKIFRIHPLTYLVALIAVLTAHFKLYLIFMLLVVVHEMGHICSGLFFKWELKEIVVLPLGLISKFDNLVNVSLNEELVVASMGIIWQLIFYMIFFRNSYEYYWCNRVIVIFNLLPIYPLDGSKILNVLLNKIFSFKSSYLISLYLSFILSICLILIGIIYKYLIIIIVILPLLMGLIKEYQKRFNVINKFYLERYLYHFNFSKIKNIKGLKIAKMKKSYSHYFYIKNKRYSEDEILEKLFDKP